jgi:ABC-2 type transport system permease protein
MNTRAILAVIRKDLKVIAGSKGVLVPLIIVPVVIFVALPALAALAPAAVNIPGMSLSNIQSLLTRMPAGLQAQLAGYDEAQKIIVLVLVYLLAPMFLIVPLMVASVIAADSFAGEKERKTLEALLYTPTTDLELFVAKMLSAWLPAMGVAIGGFVLYGIVANLASWPVMGRIFFPNLMWVVLVIWVAPAVAGLGLGTMVLVSSRVSGFQEAYQLGGAIVIPIVILVVGQSTGVMYFSTLLVVLLGLVFWIVDAALLWFGVRTFRRGELIARL